MSAQISPRITCLPIVPKAGLALLASLSFALQPAYADEIQAGRYSVVSLLPTSAQRDPLSSVVDTTLPDAATSIGEALDILLAGSGYRLSAPTTAPAGVPVLVTRADAPRTLFTLLTVLFVHTCARATIHTTAPRCGRAAR